MNQNRNINLDLMRFLGVLIIMVAHANPPEWLFNLRNFGTPLLIVASALTYSVIYSKKTMLPYPFIKKRLSRLIIPPWIFLTFFFIFFLVVTRAFGKEYPFSLDMMLSSYTFYSGIGFVWIFKVYLILALITPLALKIRDSNSSNTVYFLALAFVYFLYECLVYFAQPYIAQSYEEFIRRVVFIIIPYSILYLYGMRLALLSNRHIAYIVIFSLCLFTFLAVWLYIQNGSFVPTQEYKYPPTLYYLAYAFFALNLIYLVCKNVPLNNEKFNRVVVWLSSNSLWIYLWHIMAIFLWAYIFKDTQGFIWFVCKASFLLGFGVVATAVQKYVVMHLFSKENYIGGRIITALT